MTSSAAFSIDERSPSPLLSLTPEVLQEVLTSLDPCDVSSVSATCKSLHAFCLPSNNALLWKTLFHMQWDPLTSCQRAGFRYPWPEGGEPDYASIVQERTRARGVVRSPHSDKKRQHRPAVLRALVDILDSADSGTHGNSKNARFLTNLLSSKTAVQDWMIPPAPPARCDSPSPSDSGNGSDILLDSPSRNTRSRSRSQTSCSSSLSPQSSPAPHMAAHDAEYRETVGMACKLHLAGLSKEEILWTSYKSGQAYREQVYMGKNFDERNGWGPFLKTRSTEEDDPMQEEDEDLEGEDVKREIDWVLLHSVVNTMALNVKSAWHQWAELEEMDVLPYGFSRAVMYKPPPSLRDWAGVEGDYSYIYAFIDYNDYFAYNFASSSLQGREIPGGNLNNVSEAVGGVNTLRLRLLDEKDGVRSNGSNAARGTSPGPAKPTDPYDSPSFPTLHFTGDSLGPNGSTFRGTVRLLKDGNRHWSFIIRYSGADRWQTEGIQIGQRGIYGVWSDVLHEELSPCGPVWYYKE